MEGRNFHLKGLGCHPGRVSFLPHNGLLDRVADLQPRAEHTQLGDHTAVLIGIN